MEEPLIKVEDVLNGKYRYVEGQPVRRSHVDMEREEMLGGESTKEFNLPDGYQFKDENGNEILTSKIILEKKKPKYPKTYEECCKVMGVNHTNDLDICEHCDYKTEITYYEDSLLENIEALYRLIICRDAYWKIAGEEMGLGESWKPNFKQGEGIKYTILFANGKVIWNRPECICTTGSRILAFPNKEMRDAFYEVFKELIEECKELL